MTVRNLDHDADALRALRAELDNALSARSHTAQRGQALAEAVRRSTRPTAGSADSGDLELARQLRQARLLHERLDSRCRELTEQLLRLEDQQGAGRIDPAQDRTIPEDPTTLAQRIAGLHRSGSTQESAAVAAKAALALSPVDVAALAALLRTEGPPGASGFLARSASRGAAEQAVRTLAELRRAGLVDEAAELFHAMWATPAAELPALLSALDGAGQSADGETLLWEWASAPPAELAALAASLGEAGRTENLRRLLHQAAGRPAAEVTAVAAALDHPLTAELLAGTARLRGPADLVELGRLLGPDTDHYQSLLAGILALDELPSRSALAALRAAGLPTEPPSARVRIRVFSRTRR